LASIGWTGGITGRSTGRAYGGCGDKWVDLAPGERLPGVVIMAHDDEGSGPTVVLLHSGVCDRRMWGPQMASLQRTHRVIAPDLRGFGQTPLPPERFANAVDVVELLDHCGVDRAALVGSSFGGRVALEVVATRPDRVSALVLLCAGHRGIRDTAASEAFEAEEERLLAEGDIDGAVELNVSTWLGPSASKDTRALVREMQRHAFEVQLAAEVQEPWPELVRVDADPSRVETPTLVVGGELDMDCFRDGARDLADAIPGARLTMLPWAAHLPSLERPDDVTPLISAFLAEVSS
jgi:3-oxoadipate enol-lactonase